MAVLMSGGNKRRESLSPRPRLAPRHPWVGEAVIIIIPRLCKGPATCTHARVLFALDLGIKQFDTTEGG